MNYCRMELDLLRDESLRLIPYRCSRGHLTVGVGHKIRQGDNISENDCISLERAGLFLMQDISTSVATACQTFGREHFESMSDARQRAIVNMIFNLGRERFLEFEKMIAAVMFRDWQTASVECLDSKYARQVGRRADRVAYALRTGEDMR